MIIYAVKNEHRYLLFSPSQSIISFYIYHTIKTRGYEVEKYMIHWYLALLGAWVHFQPQLAETEPSSNLQRMGNAIIAIRCMQVDSTEGEEVQPSGATP